MIVTIAIILTLVPALMIVWPLYSGSAPGRVRVRRGCAAGRPDATLGRRRRRTRRAPNSITRWGTCPDHDYAGLRAQLMTEAADLMREMELSEDEEERMLAGLREELLVARSRIEGESGDEREGQEEPNNEPTLPMPARSPEQGQ